MKPYLCLGTGMGFDIPDIEQLETIKNAGFDAVFTDDKRNLDIGSLINKAAKLGLRYQSLHAPFYGMDDLWHDEQGDLANKMTADVMLTIDHCKEYDIPIAVCHVIIGMDNHSPNKLGLDRISGIVEYAEKKNVNIAFENTEGEEYLDAVFKRFGSCENVGFCYDTGHAMCYNKGIDIPGKYGRYLIATHINDNMGQTDPDEVTFYDDSHMLPFDGIGNWDKIAENIKNSKAVDTLTFELVHCNRPERHTNDIYSHMTFEEYVNEAYSRAVKVRELYINA